MFRLEDKPKDIVFSVTLKCPILKANGFILCVHVYLLKIKNFFEEYCYILERVLSKMAK